MTTTRTTETTTPTPPKGIAVRSERQRRLSLQAEELRTLVLRPIAVESLLSLAGVPDRVCHLEIGA